MSRLALFAVIVVSLSGPAAAADPVKLEPNATLRFGFLDLPETLPAMAGGKKQVPTLTATLPANYTPDGKFPVFVWLQGTDRFAAYRSS